MDLLIASRGGLEMAARRQNASARRVPWDRLATLGDGVITQPSDLGGYGLFAERPFARGDWITEYQGTPISRDQAQQLRKENRHWHVYTLEMQHHYVDGLKSDTIRVGNGAASLANDANWSPQGYSRRNLNNAVDVIVDNPLTGESKMVLRALRDIEIGEEITFSYMDTRTQNV